MTRIYTRNIPRYFRNDFVGSATTSGQITLWKVDMSETNPKFQFQYTSSCQNQLIIHKIFFEHSGRDRHTMEKMYTQKW